MPDVNNRTRAEWALKAIQAFNNQAGGHGNGLFTNIQDLLCNLRHVCRQRQISWENVLAASEPHFAEEIGLYWMGPEDDLSKLPHCRECPNRTPYSYNDIPYCLKCFEEIKRHGNKVTDR